MTRLTPEMRGTVQDAARDRLWCLCLLDEGPEVVQRVTTRFIEHRESLLAADAGAGEAVEVTCPNCRVRYHALNDRCPNCAHKPLGAGEWETVVHDPEGRCDSVTVRVTPADRDAELDAEFMRLLSEYRDNLFSRAIVNDRGGVTARDYPHDRGNLLAHVRRLVEEARGETVGYAVVRKSQWGDMGFQPIALLRHTIVRGEAIRVRLVRAPEEAGYE